MAEETTYTALRAGLSAVLSRVANDQEVVIVRRKNGGDVALVPAGELASLLETAHLLRSPLNARRLIAALRSAQRGKVKPSSLDQLRREMRLDRDR